MRSAASDRHGQLRGAHHRGPRAGWSSPRPGRAAPRAPASSAHWPTTAPPARRPSPPGRGDRQRAAPAGRLQVHGREPRAGSAWPCCRSRSSPVAARWSIATKRRAGGWPAPRPAGHPAWLPPPTPRQSAAPVPVAGFHTSAGPPAREDGRRAARSRFRAGEAPLMDYLAVLRGARSPPRVGLGLAAGPHTPQRGPRRRVPSPPTPPCGACRRRACSRWPRSERQIQPRRPGIWAVEVAATPLACLMPRRTAASSPIGIVSSATAGRPKPSSASGPPRACLWAEQELARSSGSTCSYICDAADPLAAFALRSSAEQLCRQRAQEHPVWHHSGTDQRSGVLQRRVTVFARANPAGGD